MTIGVGRASPSFGVGRASRPPLPLALTLASALTACVSVGGGGSSGLSSVPPPELKQLDDGNGRINAPKPARFCDHEAEPVNANAAPDIVKGIHALSALTPSALKKHLRSEVQARVERAMFLHGADAVSVNEEPLDPMTGVENEVAALLAEGKACNAAIVTGEMRIDFPPPFNDTRDENAKEIDAVHDVLYAGTSVTGYCGPCAIYALVVAPHAGPDGGLDIIAWDSLVGSDPMGHE